MLKTAENWRTTGVRLHGNYVEIKYKGNAWLLKRQYLALFSRLMAEGDLENWLLQKIMRPVEQAQIGSSQ